MAVDLELVEAPEVVIIRVILMEESSQVLTDQAETEGAEVEAVIVMIVADVVDLQKDEKDVLEDIRLDLSRSWLG